jgi:hypothetical protein
VILLTNMLQVDGGYGYLLCCMAVLMHTHRGGSKDGPNRVPSSLGHEFYSMTSFSVTAIRVNNLIFGVYKKACFWFFLYVLPSTKRGLVVVVNVV